MKRVRLFALLLFVYLVVAIPFSVMEVIPGFTSVRPISMLEPIFAVFFGIPGCCAMAVGNLAMDIIGDGVRWSSIAGFIACFVGPFIIYLWAQRSKRPFSLREPKDLLAYVGIVLCCAITQAIIITPAVAAFYPDIDARLFASTMLMNETLFPIVFGIPVIILMQEELGIAPLKERQSA